MKKFMKAIAFVTVMCMALSTVAFAAFEDSSAVKDANNDKKINITVEGATGTEPVALYIVAKDGKLTDKPLFVDQANAVSGKATFVATIGDEEVKAVDVYAGFATYAEAKGSAMKVGTVELIKDITEVTIVKADTTITESVKAQEQTGAGVAITFDVTAPAGVSATDMIWAIRFTDAEGNKVKYSDAFDVTGYGIGTTLTTGIKLGLAFLNGSDLNNIDPVTITDVDAIFMFTDGEEILTNANDKANKAN